LLRRAFAAVAIAGVALLATACEPDPSSSPAPVAATSSQSAQLENMINNFRNANGVAGLVEAGDAMAKAQQHADDMAAQGRIFHSSSLSSGIQPGWTALGENVGVGWSLDQLESMFESSSEHRANLLNGAYNQFGVGVAQGGDGQLYVTEFFVGR